jgi:Group II intron, maturase-specific domain
VARPQERKFLGFSFTAGPEVKRVIAPKALDRFKRRIRKITRRAKGVGMKTTMEELAPYMRGWRSYFGFCETPEVLIYLTRWVRLRLRAALWRQWKTRCRRRAALLALGVRPRLAVIRPAADVALGISLGPRPFLWGFLTHTSNRSDFRHCSRSVSVTDSNRRVRTRTHGGVAGVGRRPPPLCRSNGVIVQ